MKITRLILFIIITGTLYIPSCKPDKKMAVETGEVTNILTTTADVSGVVIDVGEGATQHGHCYGKTPGLTTSGTKTELGIKAIAGVFTSNLTGLDPETKYYARAYCSHGSDTEYGSEIDFTTKSAELSEVTTEIVTNVTKTTAACGGNVTSEGGTPVSARGVCWNTSSNPTIANSKTSDGTGTGSFTSNLTGLITNALYYVRAYATNAGGTSYGNERSFIATDEVTVTDIDGNVYFTVTIGSQVWMKENLKTTKYNDGSSVSNVTDNTAWAGLTTGAYCWYNNNASLYKNTYGALYNWFAVHTEKLCPAGWHVPSDPEWTDLENYLIANGYNYDGTNTENKIAKAMCAATAWILSSYAGAAGNTDYPAYRNKSGFTAYPGGMRDRYGTFDFLSDDANWWSSTAHDPEYSWNRTINFDCIYILRYQHYNADGLSVRCVKD
jgi:uncharacterized protein (TIGR02145 family)